MCVYENGTLIHLTFCPIAAERFGQSATSNSSRHHARFRYLGRVPGNFSCLLQVSSSLSSSSSSEWNVVSSTAKEADDEADDVAMDAGAELMMRIMMRLVRDAG